MKVLSIKQPWATLIALGEKEFETRSWKTKHRGQLAIHASKSIDKDAFEFTPIEKTLRKYGITSLDDLPVGKIIATCNLSNCFEVMETEPMNSTAVIQSFDTSVVVSGDEYDFGDYTKGRFAWELSDVTALKEPIPAKGQLNLWNYDMK